MSEKALKQMDRVNMLTDLLEEKINTYKKECVDIQNIEKEKNEKGKYFIAWHRFSVTPTELKRLMMVIRSETIRLEKML